MPTKKHFKYSYPLRCVFKYDTTYRQNLLPIDQSLTNKKGNYTIIQLSMHCVFTPSDG